MVGEEEAFLSPYHVLGLPHFASIVDEDNINKKFHVNVWQNPLQYCEVISLHIIKINFKKYNA